MAGEHKISVTLWSGSWDMVLACIKASDSVIQERYPDRLPAKKRDDKGHVIAGNVIRKPPGKTELERAQRFLAKILVALEHQDDPKPLMRKLKASIEAAEIEVDGIQHYSNANFWNCINAIEKQVIGGKVKSA